MARIRRVGPSLLRRACRSTLCPQQGEDLPAPWSCGAARRTAGRTRRFRGTPSFDVVHNSRYGLGWRYLSTTCPHSDGPMRHGFRLFQELLRLDVISAIGAVLTRWSEAGA